ncbi:phosphatidate phosphatase PAH2-like isoform X2 [Magnolia sinica]|uniref:phosphatidate phosphatase PAH2-like isoform X2 n=1 Tax=Magnolia sinica TaxID=86752 RepID=UPI0026588049|nr:phosphatidate phosphatase PAH2-like isoform X2 [Magnolia sinica]
MYAVERLSNYISRGVYTVSAPFHPFGGAVDIIVVEQQDGSFKSSPWYVRFGKFQGVLKSREKVVDISVNGARAGFHMYLDHKGEAYFLKEIDDGDEGDGMLSPLSSGDEMDEQSHNERFLKAQSLNLSGGASNSVTEIYMDNGKIVKRSSSQPSSILGFMFGRKSMKDEDRLRKGGGDVERISMPKGINIAEDTMDVNSSSNPLTATERMDSASWLSGIDNLAEEANEDMQVSEREGTCGPSLHDSLDHGAMHPDIHETVAVTGSSGIGIVDTERLDEVTSPMYACLSTHEQDLRISAKDMSELSERHVVTFKQSANEIREVSSAENAGFDDILKRLISEDVVLDFQGSSLADSEEGSTVHSNISVQCDTSLASGERDNLLTVHLSKEENFEGGVSSYIYSETLVSRSTGIGGQCKEVEVHTEVLYTETELISEVNSQPESSLPLGEENSDGVSCNPKAVHEGDETSEDLITKSVGGREMQTESLSSLDIDPPSSDPVEAKIVELIHQDMGLIQEKTSESGHVENCESQSQMTDKFSSRLFGNNEVDDENPSTAPDSPDQTIKDERMLDSIKEADPQTVRNISYLSNMINQIQGEDLGSRDKMHGLQLSSEAPINPQKSNVSSIPEKVVICRMLSSENIEEDDDYLFSKTDNLVGSGSRWDETVSAAAVETGDHMMEGIEEEHEVNNTYHEPCLSSNRSFGSHSYSTAGSYTSELIQESSPTALEGLPQELGAQAGQITIPKSRLRDGGVEQLAESVPNFRGHMYDLKSYDILHPLSRSLDLSSEDLKWDVHMETLMPKAVSESNLVEHQRKTESAAAFVDTKSVGSHECLSTNPAVEISLCKHLLFEGMGADAASQAFDAEKVDAEKFSALGPLLVKNDKLVVRIGGRYFPWSAAAPIVLGMVSFGREQILVPEGMIAVDKADKAIEGESIVSSGGSWKLWPFSFRKSKAESSNKGTDISNNASESAGDIAENNNMHEGSTTKKVVRSITPTSEELASLDLKEGRNVITFTFSTAMLGKQQVDARIYLWKWNTRIVISDVDGTITKIMLPDPQIQNCFSTYPWIRCSRTIYAFGWEGLVTVRRCTFIFSNKGKWISVALS